MPTKQPLLECTDKYVVYNCQEMPLVFDEDVILTKCQLTDCRYRNPQNPNHTCRLKLHQWEYIYIQDLHFFWVCHAPSYICGNEHSRVRNLILHQDKFITPNANTIMTSPQIIRIGENRFVTRQVIEKYSNVVDDMSTNTNTIYKELYHNHKNANKLYREYIPDYDFAALKVAVNKVLVSKKMMHYVENCVQIRHILPLKKKILDYIHSLVLKKLNIDYTYRMNKNIKDQHYMVHVTDIGLSEDKTTDEEPNNSKTKPMPDNTADITIDDDNDMTIDDDEDDDKTEDVILDQDIVQLQEQIEHMNMNPIVSVKIGTETIMDQRNLLWDINPSPGATEGHHVLVMNIAKNIEAYFDRWADLHRHSIPNEIFLCTDGLMSNITIPQKTIEALKNFSKLPNHIIDEIRLYV